MYNVLVASQNSIMQVKYFSTWCRQKITILTALMISNVIFCRGNIITKRKLYILYHKFNYSVRIFAQNKLRRCALSEFVDKHGIINVIGCVWDYIKKKLWWIHISIINAGNIFENLKK